MTRARLACLLSLLLPLAGCAGREPVNGCLLAAANARQAQRFLHPSIPARILAMRSEDARSGHAALVYLLDPEGFFCYDDNYGSRPLHLSWPCATTFPPALTVARAAFPGWPIGQAWWLTAPPPR